jgi:hypothetical protein
MFVNLFPLELLRLGDSCTLLCVDCRTDPCMFYTQLPLRQDHGPNWCEPILLLLLLQAAGRVAQHLQDRQLQLADLAPSLAALRHTVIPVPGSSLGSSQGWRVTGGHH